MKEMRPETLQSFGRIERELQEERASALGRIGRTLQGLIARLESLQAALERAPASERDRLIVPYRETWERAKTYRWYLEVQREAIGLRRHERLDEMYPLPGRRPSPAQPEDADLNSRPVQDLEWTRNSSHHGFGFE
jgi:hypothetical protein